MEDGEFVLRMDPPYREGPGPFKGVALDLVFRTAEEPRHVSVMLDEEGNLREARRWRRSSEDNVVTPEPSGARAALRKILELSVPAEETGFTPGQRASFQIKMKKGGDEVALDELDILVPTLEGSGRAWSA
jgi:hypothetical protein